MPRMPGAPAAGAMPRTPAIPRAPKPIDPSKAVMAAPRLRPVSTRDYGKGGTPMSGGPNMGVQGAGIGYGGFNPNGI